MFRLFNPDDPLLVTGEVTAIRENGATSGVGVLGSFSYDDLGRRSLLVRGNGRRTSYEYDPLSRLSALVNTSFGSPADVRFEYSYNPASQIVSRWSSSDSYSQALANGTQTTTTNGLNELATVNGTSATYDARGNLTADPATGKAYTYWPSDNQLRTVGSPFTSLTYDALDRLTSVTGSDFNFAYDGMRPIADYDGSGSLRSRYVFGPSGDEALVSYDAAGNRTFLETDERGSVIARANSSGSNLGINSYDEYGVPGASNAGTFQYAGMLWLGRAGLYAPTYRAYDAGGGRFNQIDPIGFGGGVNWYAYVFNNPVNLVDPLGLQVGLGPTDRPDCIGDLCPNGSGTGQIIIVTGTNHATPTPDPMDQLSNEQLIEEIRRATVNQSKTCGGGKYGSTECTAARQRRDELIKEHNKRHPLPPIPKFEEVRPDLFDTLVGLASCGVSLIPGAGWAASIVSALGCASGARALGRTIIPEQRRVP